ncbi:DUF221-domain-containing protein [Pleurotus eryngii]|uniref:DUF221-domain-containing protein n=1 Tax=Pleurotus eryngii TaxID=5323 RepID=A0A9P6ABT2_PLEER|nr:DUF221-domain-containing protein [Pleurotus eryngii]
MSSDVERVGSALEEGRTLAPAAVGSQVVIMSGISIVTILLFNFLRPKNKIIYEPKVKYHVGNKAPPRISDSLCGWLPPLLHTKEPELVDKIGLDAVAFLRFLRLMRWFFTGVAILTCGVLIPINVMYNLDHVMPRKRDILSMMTIRDVKGMRLYAHVAISYIITFLLMGLVYFHWKRMVQLRAAWFRSPEYIQSLYARTLQITHVPKKYQSDEGIRNILHNINMPYPASAVHIGRKVGKLPELIEYHNKTVRELENVLVKYLKGGRPAKTRPTIRVGGCCGMGGQRKDAIDFYTMKLKRTEAAVEEFRNQIDTRKAENYGFISLAAVPYAHIAAKLLSRKSPKGTTITLAPNPKDIIWANMTKSDAAIARKRLVGYWWLVIFCILNLIPLLLVAILANLDAFRSTGYIGFLDSWTDSSPVTFAIVSGFLPPAVAGIFIYFLPRVMRWLTQYMGASTHARLDRAVIARYFAFLVISQLIIFTLIGVVFNSVAEIVRQIGRGKSATTVFKSLDKLPGNIHRTYINQASYWLKWFPMRGFLVVFDLAQIVNLVWIFFKTRIFGRTPRDIREWTQPSNFEYSISYSNLLFMAAVGLLFAPLAPLVALAAAVVFWMSSWVYKYQLMFVYVSKVETGGRLWNVMINRLLASVVLMQLLVVLTIGLQDKFHTLKWLSTVPPIILILIFKIFIKRKFNSKFRYYTPTEEELRDALVHSAKADVRGHRLEHRFGHPSLHTELFTPMLHARMMPLLSEVYNGKISEAEKKNGEEKETVRLIEGLTIAAVNQRDLEYDPVLYQRDRGELDWDGRSMATTNNLGSDVVTVYSKSPYTPSPETATYGYDGYLKANPPMPRPELVSGNTSSWIAPDQQADYFGHSRPTTSIYSDGSTVISRTMPSPLSNIGSPPSPMYPQPQSHSFGIQEHYFAQPQSNPQTPYNPYEPDAGSFAQGPQFPPHQPSTQRPIPPRNGP